ncbi:multicopper oxidase [Colletotrichum salicis]|uniref:Multicopper oxidase n=1 Tax=Colletotrichum salicis TaxID=1209931 RepID=A0A135UGT2_9PEZI|nr:multicopper oxidase [Colletotrichum salicis]
MLPTYIPVQKIDAKNGIVYAYRRLGPAEGIPLVLHMHVRASMGYWDPVFIRPLAMKRPVIMFDPPAVGQTTGDAQRTPVDINIMGDDLNAFLDALSLNYIDLLGFSIGSMACQMATLSRPERVRRLILVGADPSGPIPGDHFWPRTDPNLDRFLTLQRSASEADWQAAYTLTFFRNDDQGRTAADAYFKRLRQSEFNENAVEGALPAFNDVESFMIQLACIKHWCAPGVRNKHSYYRLGELTMPVLVMTGDDDYLVPTPRSYELLDGIPNCMLVIWPRAGHASIWQYAENCLLLLAVAAVFAKETRRYNLTLTYAWNKQGADGHGRPTYLINGDTPGPVLTVEEGETLEAFVDNQLPIESTIHWHGIYQKNEPWNDGVPGVTQWATEPRDNYTYRFTPEGQYGSYFYHGHFGPAFSDGQRGPLWIVPAAWRPRPYHLISDDDQDIRAMRAAENHPRHIIVADWNDQPMDMYLIRFRDTGYIPMCANSLTLNGRGGTRCESARDLQDAGGLGRNERGCRYRIPGYEYTNVESCTETNPELEVIQAAPGEEWIWINFIHSGAHHSLAISIDEHEFWVVAADGEFVHPQKVVRTHVNLGERTSILAKLNKQAGDYALRLHSLRNEQMIQGAGILRYATTKDLSRTSNRTVPSTKPWLHLNGSLVDTANKVMEEARLSPFSPRPLPPKADFTLKFTVNNTGPSTWVLDATPHEFFRQNVPPILWNEKSRGKTSWGNSHGFLKNGSVVDLIIENGANVDASHPFHKHNHKVFVIGQGQGGFPWKDVDDAIQHGGEKYFNLKTPPYRDGFTLQAGEGKFVVVRYKIDFPAASSALLLTWKKRKSGQQVILLEGMEVMPPVPEGLKKKPHVEFQMPPHYGPLD